MSKPITRREFAQSMNYSEASKYIEYDRSSGVFRWAITRRKIRSGSVAGSKNKCGYIQISIMNKKYYAHRLAWFIVYGELPDVVDHINRNTADNRIENLRKATKQQNLVNTKLNKRNKSGRKGVCFDVSKNKWIAQIRASGRMKFIGYFDCVDEAAEAYDEFATSIHGEFVSTNKSLGLI